MRIRVKTLLQYLYCLGILCFSGGIFYGQPTDSLSTKLIVTFEVVAPSLPSNTSVYITGGHPALGNWNPGAVPMLMQEGYRWQKVIELEQPQSLEYKYTLGSWAREGAGADGRPLGNLIARITRDTLISDTIRFWTQEQKPPPVQGQVTGIVRYLRQLKGTGLRDRDVIIWLPPGYEQDRGKRYPVLYMHDGQNVFDPATSSFGIDWQIDEHSDSLIRNGVIPPMIVVGIYNTPDRSAEYAPGEKGTAYMQWVVNELKPLIDSDFRTKKDRRHTWVGGSSAGGLISFMLAWEYPDVFGGAICMSPAFKIASIDYVTPVLEKARPPHLRLYIDNGGVGLEERLQPGVDAMLEALQTKGYRSPKEYWYVKDSNAQHQEAAWAKRFPQALVWLLTGG